MILVLVGLMGTGKSTIGKKLAKDLGYSFLEISDVVKGILNERNRSTMVRESLHKKQEDPLWLAEPLRQKLLEERNWIISGVREIVLVDTIRDMGQLVHIIRLTCPDKIRLKRCKDKHKTLDALLKADEVDRNLGIDQVLAVADSTLSTGKSLKETRANLVDLVDTLVHPD